MTLPAAPDASTALPAAAVLWKPVLIRAAIALGFGAVTVFWAAPTAMGMGWAGGAYLLATGLVLLRSIHQTGLRPGSAAGKVLSAAGAVLTGTGAAVGLISGSLVFGVLAALGLGLAGAAELYLGITLRGRSLLARDWIASGVIGLGTAALLPFFIDLGPHALLGIAGGGGIISGVLWVLAGLTLRHDAQADSAEAVN
ncbi:hypothetical protein QK292_10730 [Arthrobacter sp. AL08]|uniref:hypothetical protein n=1 Tax=Micrococcaceae TaxID=1268 RepID=UPI001CFF999B|nr:MULTISPECIES: hypothetical protein [Micrococcaceae]MCB5283036.1 hypothetical protein [Arthrobacter sp. ES1]MDI3242013.1 hypothetical protein [Arthrobacter sp. AL05]MDI3278047.1 hypothetical protein [Arthrobacter sp. AL08]MDJ0352561.1 hypothetical protein [Pseudarthrobacter sp. PH31-O2]WGZ79344.1 hypothetical protein QI450_16120 [Arthrobacter sp. EM1]